MWFLGERNARIRIDIRNRSGSIFDRTDAFTCNASGITQQGPGTGHKHARGREGSVPLPALLPAVRLPAVLLLFAVLSPLRPLFGLWLAIRVVTTAKNKRRP